MKTVVWFVFVLSALSAAGKVLVVNPGEAATLECGVSTYSSSLEWRHGNDLIINERNRQPPRKGKSDTVGRSRVTGQTNLMIRGVKEGDAGKFICMADGSSHEHTLVVVSVSASPSSDLQLGSQATLHCRVIGLNPDPTVQWKGPGGSLKSGSLQSVAHSDAGTWMCTFSHAGETYDEPLDIKVQDPAATTPAPAPAPTPVPSQNSKDVGKKNCPTCVTDPPPKAYLLLGLSWWIWVTAGVGCLVAVVLVVVVICLYKRIKQKKRKLHKMKNSRQLPMSNEYCKCSTAAEKPQQGRRREKPSAPPLQTLLME